MIRVVIAVNSGCLGNTEKEHQGRISKENDTWTEFLNDKWRGREGNAVVEEFKEIIF